MNTKNRELFIERAKLYFKDRADEFIKLIDDKPTSGFFLNEKKADRETILSLVDFDYSPFELNPKSFKSNEESIGKSKAYELGLIYPQDNESSMPSTLFDPTNIKTAIDLCAAPGGKSINTLNKLNDDVLFISNDVSNKRASILSNNLERMGFENCLITNLKPEYLADKFEGLFDLVILDAPCSGEGMIRKYPEILDTYSTANILSIAEVQKNLLDAAYKLLNEGGQLVYSTCTFAFEEDEDQVNNFLNKYKDMKLVGDCKKLSFLDGCEGQFMALLKKDGTLVNKKYKPKKTVNNKTVASFIKDNIDIDEYYLYSHDNNYYLSLMPMPDLDRGIVRTGIYLGEVKKYRFEPAYNLYRSNKLKFKYKYDLNDDEYNKFIKGESLQVNLSNHYYQVTYKGFPLAYGKCSNNELKNKYPKGLRRVV